MLTERERCILADNRRDTTAAIRAVSTGSDVKEMPSLHLAMYQCSWPVVGTKLMVALLLMNASLPSQMLMGSLNCGVSIWSECFGHLLLVV